MPSFPNRMSAKTISRAAIAAAAVLASALASPPALAQNVPDLVSRTAFRVCEDPANPPFSTRKKDGFENKIADIIADSLKRPVRYFWAPSGPGFVRNTLNEDLCDVVMGYTIGAEMVQATNPYYRSTYVIVVPKGSPLADVQSIDDPKLKGHKIGVFEATPPTDAMLKNGTLGQAKLYPLLVDHRFNSPLDAMLADLKAKATDAVVVWGPLIGESVKTSDGALVMTPLLKDVDRPGYSYRIALGVRHDENEWKHTLEGVLRKRKADINRVLADYNVPLIDNLGHLIPPATATSEAAPKIEPAATGGNAPAPQAGERSKPVPKGFQMPGPAPTNQ